MTGTSKPDILGSRRRRGGLIPGMEPSTTSPEKEVEPAPPVRPPAPSDSGNKPSKSKRPAAPAVKFEGARKMTVTTRSYAPLWQAYGDLAREVSREAGAKVFQADLVNAVLATCLPSDAAEARECLDQYRALLEADPPGDMRVV